MEDKKKQKQTSLISLFLAKKNSKNKNFNTVIGHLVAIYVYNMWKFHKNRFTGFEDIVETVRKNVFLIKTRFQFFVMKSHEQILPQVKLHTILLEYIRKM